MTTLKHHMDGRVSRSGETKLGTVKTSSPTEVEKEIADHMKIMKGISKIFHRTTNNEVKKMNSRLLRRKK